MAKRSQSLVLTIKLATPVEAANIHGLLDKLRKDGGGAILVRTELVNGTPSEWEQVATKAAAAIPAPPASTAAVDAAAPKPATKKPGVATAKKGPAKKSAAAAEKVA